MDAHQNLVLLATAAMTHRWGNLRGENPIRQRRVDGVILMKLNPKDPHLQIEEMVKLMKLLDQQQREWVTLQVRTHYGLQVHELRTADLEAAFQSYRLDDKGKGPKLLPDPPEHTVSITEAEAAALDQEFQQKRSQPA